MVRLFASLSLTLVPLVGCTTAGERADGGECPAGEVCSARTPNGLHFYAPMMSDQILPSGPAPTAIGGTQDIRLEYEWAGTQRPLDLAYIADDDGARGVQVLEQAENVVTVGGVDDRSNYLRIIDADTDELFDRYEVFGASVAEIGLVGVEGEITPPGVSLVWAPGDQRLGVGLYGEVQGEDGPETRRLVDTSMALTLQSSQRESWDRLRVANATVGTHSLLVEAGDRPAATVPFEVVAGADSIALVDGAAPTVPPNSSSTVCFWAKSGDRYIYGLTWQYTVDGVASTSGKSAPLRNCVVVSSSGRSSGTIAVSAAAGGKQLSLDVVIGTARSTAERRRPVIEQPTAGDRARW